MTATPTSGGGALRSPVRGGDSPDAAGGRLTGKFLGGGTPKVMTTEDIDRGFWGAAQ